MRAFGSVYYARDCWTARCVVQSKTLADILENVIHHLLEDSWRILSSHCRPLMPMALDVNCRKSVVMIFASLRKAAKCGSSQLAGSIRLASKEFWWRCDPRLYLEYSTILRQPSSNRTRSTLLFLFYSRKRALLWERLQDSHRKMGSPGMQLAGFILGSIAG